MLKMVAAKYLVIFIAAFIFVASTMMDVSTAMPMPGGNHGNNNHNAVAALLVAGALASLLQGHHHP